MGTRARRGPGGFTGPGGRRPVDAEPAVAVASQLHGEPAVGLQRNVAAVEQVQQDGAPEGRPGRLLRPHCAADLHRVLAKVVQQHQRCSRRAARVGKDRRLGLVDDGEVAPAQLRGFAVALDQCGDEVPQRLRIPLGLRRVDLVRAELPTHQRRHQSRCPGFGEAAVLFAVPLHGRADGDPARCRRSSPIPISSP